MKFFIVVNNSKKSAIVLYDDVKSFLSNSKTQGVINQVVENVDDCDLIITLGGDGTILDAWGKYRDKGKAFFGINCGHLGYMTGATVDNWKEKLTEIINLNYKIDKRLVVCSNIRDKENRNIYYNEAMNDIVLCKKSTGVIKFDIYVDNKYLTSMVADGLICSSPNGSTGYAISVGGGFIDPNSSLIQLIAIAPHSLMNRSIILNKNSFIEVVLRKDSEPAVLLFDGVDSGIEINQSNKAVMGISMYNTMNIVSLNDTDNFLEKISKAFGNFVE